MSCNRCKGSSTDPYNFLLSCSECGKRWHHRCHIPPLNDSELTALIRATNDNDIDNSLASWIGRCCKRKRVRVPEAVSRPAELPKPQTHSVSPARAVPPNAASIRQVSQIPTQCHDQTRKTTPRDDVAAPDSEHTTSDPGFSIPQTPMTTLVRQTVQRSTTVSLDMAAAEPERPERSRTMPLPSTSASRSGNVTSTSIPHLGEISLPLLRTPLSQPTDPTHVQAHPRSSKRTSPSENVGSASDPMEIDIDLPTLDLRALTLTQAPSSFDQTASRPHTPPPAAAAEDDEIEDLYGPPLGLPSVHAPPPPPPQPSEPPAPRLLPVLAAEDPRILATLERHERREAARPRQGMRKAPAVRRAGSKRAGLVLVVADRATEAEAEGCRREPRGVFASYFARSSA